MAEQTPTTPAPQPIAEVSFEEVRDGLQSGSVILVDVRGKEELQTQGAIPNSTNIPLPELQDFLNMLSEEEFTTRFGFNLINNKTAGDKTIVFSCRSGKRAEMALEVVRTRVVKDLEKAGEDVDVPIRPDIKLYRGSFLDWVEKGGALEK